MESTTTETPIWTTVLRATTNERDEHGITPIVHASWTLESAAAESGLTITQVFFGDELQDLEGNKVVWDYQYHYEIEHKEDGLCMSLWWPVLHKPLAADQPAAHELFIGLYAGQVAGFYANESICIKAVSIDSSDLDGLQEIEYIGDHRLADLHHPARPIPNVLVLVEGGIVEVGTDMPIHLYVMDLDIQDEESEPTKQEKDMFDLVWNRLPEHRGVDDNGSIYDFSAVGL